jgi:hypothetical protein
VERGIWRPPVALPTTEAPTEEPTFHQFASEWIANREHEVDKRTVANWKWALSCHLLPFFKSYTPSLITVALVEQYKTAKLRERDAAAKAKAANPKGTRGARIVEQVDQCDVADSGPGARPCRRPWLGGHKRRPRPEAPAEGGEAAENMARNQRAPGAARRGPVTIGR